MADHLIFLMDTNVLIPVEPTASENVEALTERAGTLIRMIRETGNDLVVHPELYRDIGRDKNEKRRHLRLLLANKYPRLRQSPPITDDITAALGPVTEDSHDWIDHHLLAAVVGGAVQFLLTEDAGLHRKAVKLGVDERVLTVADALDVVRSLYEFVPTPPPATVQIRASRLDPNDPIFETLRRDYRGFEEWLKKVREQNRTAWIVEPAGEGYAGVCIVKEETPGEHNLYGRLLKLCTFKVSESHEGYRYGELLLKAVFDYAETNSYDWLFTEVLPDKEFFINYMGEFGFELLPLMKNDREHVIAKHRTYSDVDFARYEPFEFHVRFGPPAVKWEGVPAFIVPILPKYHERLFPEAELQTSMFAGREAHGNSLRKAYLSRASIRQLKRGDLLYFYESHTTREVTTAGVVEEVHAMSDPKAIVAAVGKRTLYAYSEIDDQTQHGVREVLVVSFRQAKVLPRYLGFEALKQHNVVVKPPRTIQSIGPEGAEWIAKQTFL